MSRQYSVLSLIIILAGLLNPTEVLAAQKGRLEFVPDNLSLQVDQTQTLNIVSDPQGNQVVGADIFLTFDPEILEISDITKSDAIDELLGLQINNLTGKAKFSVVNHKGKYLLDERILARFTIKAKKPGRARISFEFSPRKTQDTNLVNESSVDILGIINNAQINISQPPIISPTTRNNLLGTQAVNFNVNDLKFKTVNNKNWLILLGFLLCITGITVWQFGKLKRQWPASS